MVNGNATLRPAYSRIVTLGEGMGGAKSDRDHKSPHFQRVVPICRLYLSNFYAMPHAFIKSQNHRVQRRHERVSPCPPANAHRHGAPLQAPVTQGIPHEKTDVLRARISLRIDRGGRLQSSAFRSSCRCNTARGFAAIRREPSLAVNLISDDARSASPTTRTRGGTA
jgi:hypothetical protein